MSTFRRMQKGVDPIAEASRRRVTAAPTTEALSRAIATLHQYAEANDMQSVAEFITCEQIDVLNGEHGNDPEFVTGYVAAAICLALEDHLESKASS